LVETLSNRELPVLGDLTRHAAAAAAASFSTTGLSASGSVDSGGSGTSMPSMISAITSRLTTTTAETSNKTWSQRAPAADTASAFISAADVCGRGKSGAHSAAVAAVTEVVDAATSSAEG